jgi:hypothetical protein
MNRAVSGAMAIAFGLYLVIGLCGTALFGMEHTRDNILLNFSPAFLELYPRLNMPLFIGRCCMGLALLLCAPIAMWPFRSCVLSVYLRLKHKRQTPSALATNQEFRSITIMLVMLIFTAAVVVPSVKIPLSIVGSVAGSLIIFIMPSLFFLLQQPPPLIKMTHAGPIAMFLVGVCIGTLCLSMTLYKLTQQYHL